MRETQMHGEKMIAPRAYEQTDPATSDERQVTAALKYLDQAIERLDHQAGRLLDACEQVMQPEELAAETAKLDSVPRQPVAPLARVIENLTDRITRTADRLASGTERTQL
jgi:hypothetical protein